MPIIICLKEPQINLICAGDIKDGADKQYDELFPNLMVKDMDGHNMVLPLSVECNIAFIKEVTKEEIDKQKAAAEKRREQNQGLGSSILSPAQMTFPRGVGSRRS